MYLFQYVAFFFMSQILYPLLGYNIIYCFNNVPYSLYFIYTILSLLPTVLIFLEFLTINNKENIINFCFFILCFPFLFLLKDLFILHIYSDTNILKYPNITLVRALSISEVEHIFEKEYKNPNVNFGFLDKKELLFQSKLVERYEFNSYYLVDKQQLVTLSKEKYDIQLKEYLLWYQNKYSFFGYDMSFLKPIATRITSMFLTSLISSSIDFFFLKYQNKGLLTSLESLRDSSTQLNSELSTQLHNLHSESLEHKKLLELNTTNIKKITKDIDTISLKHSLLNDKISTMNVDPKDKTVTTAQVNDEMTKHELYDKMYGGMDDESYDELDVFGIPYNDHVKESADSTEDQHMDELFKLLQVMVPTNKSNTSNTDAKI